MKKLLTTAVFIFCAIGLSGCINFSYTEKPTTPATPTPAAPVAPEAPVEPSAPIVEELPKTESVTYFTSIENYTNFCNGEKSDSAGYKLSMTKKTTAQVLVPEKIPNFYVSRAINLTVSEAAKESGLSPNLVEADDYNYIIYNGVDTVYIAPTEGWAGVSIFLCAWKPLVEKNLEQFSMVKKIVWMTDRKAFDNLK